MQNNELKSLRMKLGLTQSAAADRAGVSLRTYSSYENKEELRGTERYLALLHCLEQKPHNTAKEKETLPLPVGVVDYREAVSKYYYVDKTLFIKDFLNDIPKVSLFTRPRRFGKTLTMDMLRVFFEQSEEDTSQYFRNKAIWQCGEVYTEHQGKYPVIFLTFKDIKCPDWPTTYRAIGELLKNEFERHPELADSPHTTPGDRAYYAWMTEEPWRNDTFSLDAALQVLSRMLSMHYRQSPFILIDEYDVPIGQGHEAAFYDDVILFMRNLFSGGLKDNPHLAYGIMTGILRISQESIFSGLNNLKVYSLLDEKYSQYFGFTAEEVRDMAAYYGVAEKYDELCTWYDGYRFGNTDIFNPWSVLNYISDRCVPQAYWVATSQNAILREVLTTFHRDVYETLELLLQGRSVTVPIETNITYADLAEDPVSVYSILLLSGYLKVVEKQSDFFIEPLYTVTLPNLEISHVYRREIMAQLRAVHVLSTRSVTTIQKAMFQGDVPLLKSSLEQFLLESVSFHDTTTENFYHGLMLGFCALFGNSYEVQSNLESGDGRFDIQLRPRETTLPGILIELKSAGDATTPLAALAQRALTQIEEKQYDTTLKAAGVQNILKYGIAFSKKQVEIAMQ